MTKLDSILKKQRHHFAYKIPCTESYIFSMSYIQMWELDCKEGWVPKINAFKLWYWRRLRDSIKLDNSKGNPSWMFSGRTNGKLQYFGYLMQRADPLEKTLMLGKFEGERRRGYYHTEKFIQAMAPELLWGLITFFPSLALLEIWLVHVFSSPPVKKNWYCVIQSSHYKSCW